MKAIITGIRDNLTENKQQELGQALLITMCHVVGDVDGVKIEFQNE